MTAISRSERRWRKRGRAAKRRVQSKNDKPLYVIRMEDDVFFNKDIVWGGSARVKATHLTHKEALPICSRLKRLGYTGASVEALIPSKQLNQPRFSWKAPTASVVAGRKLGLGIGCLTNGRDVIVISFDGGGILFQ